MVDGGKFFYGGRLECLAYSFLREPARVVIQRPRIDLHPIILLEADTRSVRSMRAPE